MDWHRGALDALGYYRLTVDGKVYYCHRLAWLLHTAQEPVGLVDHINGDKSDNRINNLRLCTHQQNLLNRGKNKNNTTGFKGVTLIKSTGRFCAHIAIDRVNKHLGVYATAEAAAAAYARAAAKLHGEYARFD